MNNFFKSTTFKVLLVVAIILVCATVLATVVSGKTSPLTNVVDFITSPLQNVASYFSAKLDGATGGFISSESYRDRVAELEQQVADYQAQLVDYEKTKKQLESYEEFLDVREKNPDYTWVYSTVIGRDSADIFGSFTINKGSNDGIKVNDAVIYSEYLVGVVTEVNPTSAVVRSVFDPSVHVAAYEIRTGELGYTNTNYDMAVNGNCALSALDRNTSISKGGIVCTSGTGGIFPKDLIIGTVSTVKQSETDLSAYAIVEPPVKTKDIHDCFVITDFTED
ncbi:MAG: rod shape-determining protein MreC [Clostridia bacterium]|nr:rod shape-determining protein MreC [Clostridia bacterium]